MGMWVYNVMDDIHPFTHMLNPFTCLAYGLGNLVGLELGLLLEFIFFYF
jgi:hypothetical protein